MAYSNGRITKPVNQYDVQRALSISSPHWNDLCANDQINKWARYKPIRVDGVIGEITYQTRKNKMFGIDVPYCTNCIMNAMVYYLYNEATENDKWNYLMPRGDRSAQGQGREFYRITDYVRNSQETSQSANGDPTPVNLQGYNHMAKIPFEAFLNSAGVTEKYSLSMGGTYYEVNKQVVSTLKFTFFNNPGDDLHLQDFIDLASSHSNNIAWRPVLQVFNGFDSTAWQNKSQPDIERAGDVITTSTDATFSVELDVSNFTPSAVNLYHLCLGVGCCNQASPIIWNDNNNSLFILPYTQQQFDDNEFPFYYRFVVVSYMSRRINVTQIQFFQSQTTWVVASASGSTFTINSNAGTLIRVMFTITKEPSQSLEFIGQNGSVESASNDPLKVQVRETVNYVETIKYLRPRTSTWQAPANNPVVTTGQTSEIVTLYADFDMANINVGDYADYHIYAYTGASEGGSDKYDNIGSFRIYKEQYH